MKGRIPRAVSSIAAMRGGATGLLAACALVAGCSAPSAPAAEGRALAPAEPAPTFGPDDRRAAQLLSIANTAALDNAASPYQQALLCAVSVERLMARLESSGALDVAQIDAVQRLQADFERRARQLKEEVASLNADRRAISDQHSAPELAQIALGCLQRSV